MWNKLTELLPFLSFEKRKAFKRRTDLVAHQAVHSEAEFNCSLLNLSAAQMEHEQRHGNVAATAENPLMNATPTPTQLLCRIPAGAAAVVKNGPPWDPTTSYHPLAPHLPLAARPK